MSDLHNPRTPETDETAKLVDLLAMEFAPESLYRLVDRLFGRTLSAEMPTPGGLSAAEYSFQVVEALRRHGLLDNRFFRAVAERVPDRRAEVAHLAAAHGVEISIRLSERALLGASLFAAAGLAVLGAYLMMPPPGQAKPDVTHPPAPVKIEGSNNTIIQSNSGPVEIVAQSPHNGCDSSSLSFVMEVDGNLIPGVRGGSGSRYASGRLYQFTLSNRATHCVIVVKNIEMGVLDVVPDSHPAMEATTATNQYEVEVGPEDKGKKLALKPLAGAPRTEWGYHFTPESAPDRFAVHVIPTSWGYSYAIQFVASWYDAGSGDSFTTKSGVYGAFFPEGAAEMFGGDDAFAWREEQLRRWSASLGVAVR